MVEAVAELTALPQRDVQEPLVEEAAQLACRIRSQTEQAERLRRLAERIDERTAQDRAVLEDLQGVLGSAAQLRIDDFDRLLGGQRLERVAIELLKARKGLDAEIHYREWFDLVEDEGHRVRGLKPLATFLAQLNRSEHVKRVGHRTGRYRLVAAA
jgi:hypothetical protein